jgi:hypothetical protein
MFLIVVFARFLGVTGHHEDEFLIERLDVNNNGEIVASISHDNRFETIASDDTHAVIDLHLAKCLVAIN